MNMIKQELRMNLRSLITWCLSLLAILILFMLFFPALSDQMEEFQKVFNSFPPAFQAALKLDTITIDSIMGYYQFAFSFILLGGAIQAMNLGVAIISQEVRMKTGDFLFVKPITRNRVVTMKMLAALILITMTNLILGIGASIVLLITDAQSFDLKTFLLINGSLFFTQLFFLSLGLFLSAFLKRIRTVLPVSLGVVFFFYVISMIQETVNDPKLRLISPFDYFNLAEIMERMEYNASYLLLWMLLTILFVLGTYWLFRRKDLPAI
ncbi:ABC transporter permease subunit [Eubacteriaceae bacterium ES2]|nr:ABC transporter permease subunit [Eubacteriaceae bacterium ES2]